MGVEGGLKIGILAVTSFLNGSLWKGIIFKRPVQFSKAVHFYATFKLWKLLPYIGLSSRITIFRKYTLKLQAGNYRVLNVLLRFTKNLYKSPLLNVAYKSDNVKKTSYGKLLYNKIRPENLTFLCTFTTKWRPF